MQTVEADGCSKEAWLSPSNEMAHAAAIQHLVVAYETGRLEEKMDAQMHR